MTRIIAGRFGGRRLEVPAGKRVRPTADRVREALFSTLGHAVVDASVLDLFAGTGALGIEALSRGARHATFVEQDRGVASVLRGNLERLDVTAIVCTSSAARFASGSASTATHEPYDVVFCDPPYRIAAQHVVTLLGKLVSAGRSSDGAMMVVERTRRSPPLEVPSRVGVVDDVRTYGDTMLYYVRSAPSDQEGRPS